MPPVAAYQSPAQKMDRYYEPPDKKVHLNFKVRASLRVRLDGLVRLWKHVAKLQGDDPEDVDLTHVCERLLSIGVDGAWGDVGGFPASEEEWGELLERLEANAKAAAAKKK